jgi:hypothetical protein
MGWFSKKIPERNWTDVGSTLGRMLKTEGESWYSIFQRQTAPRDFALVSDRLSPAATHYVSLLQLQAVAATLKNNGYVSDATFFLELVYIMLTGNLPAQLHRDIEATPFCLAGDAIKSITLWAQSIAGELSSNKDDSTLIAELEGYGAFIVSRAQFATCLSCGDKKGAEKARNSFVGN